MTDRSGAFIGQTLGTPLGSGSSGSSNGAVFAKCTWDGGDYYLASNNTLVPNDGQQLLVRIPNTNTSNNAWLVLNGTTTYNLGVSSNQVGQFNTYSGYVYPSAVNHNGVFVVVGANSSGNGTVSTSSNGTSWTAQTPAGNLAWGWVCSNGTTLVAVSTGASTNTMYSSNGTSWTAGGQTFNSGKTWGGIAAVGSNVTIVEYAGSAANYTQNGGVTWAQCSATMPTSARPGWICASNGTFAVAVASTNSAFSANGLIAYTANGAAWAPAGTPPSGNWQAIAWNGNVWLALSNNQTVATSSNPTGGAAWTTKSAAYQIGNSYGVANFPSVSATNSTGPGWNLVGANGVFYATVTSSSYGNTQLMYISRDNGSNWFSRVIPSAVTGYLANPTVFQNFSTIVSSNTILVGGKTANATTTMLAFAPVPVSAIGNSYPLTKKGGLPLSGGDLQGSSEYEVVIESSHALPSYAEVLNPSSIQEPWVVANSTNSNTSYIQATYAPSNYATLYDGLALSFRSTNTVTTNFSTNVAVSFVPGNTTISNTTNFSVAYGNGTFVAISDAGLGTPTAWWSADANTWTQSATTFNGAQGIRQVQYGNGVFVATPNGGNTCMYSANGQVWANAGMAGANTNNWDFCSFNGSIFGTIQNQLGAPANTGVFQYSSNGSSWTAANMPASAYWQGLIQGNGTFVALSANNIAASSTTGLTANWVLRTMPDNTVGWCAGDYGANGVFVCFPSTAQSFYALSVDNGVTWVKRVLPTSIAVNMVKWTGSYFLAIAGGSSNKYMISKDGYAWTNYTYTSNFNPMYTSIAVGANSSGQVIMFPSTGIAGSGGYVTVADSFSNNYPLQFNPDGNGANTVTKFGGNPIESYDINPNQEVIAILNKTNNRWEVVNPISNNPADVRQTVIQGKQDSTGKAAYLYSPTGGTSFQLYAGGNNPNFVITFAAGQNSTGAVDLYSQITTNQTGSALAYNATNFVYATYVSPTAITLGTTQAPPQVGPTWNQSAQSLLHFEFDLTGTITDDFGNLWTTTGYAGSSNVPAGKFGLSCLGGSGTGAVLNGTTEYAKSTAFTSLGNGYGNGIGGWALRTWVYPNSATTAYGLMSAVNAAGYGLTVTINSSGKFVYYLSSTGSSWDIASAVVGSNTVSATTWGFLEVTFDPISGKYYAYFNGVLDSTIATSTKSICGITSMTLGQANLATVLTYFTGSFDEFELLPYCKNPGGVAYTAPVAASSITTPGYASDWFNTSTYLMYSISGINGSVSGTNTGGPPQMTLSLKQYIGEIATNFGGTTSVISYALNGAFVSPWTNTLPSTGVTLSQAHNLGTTLYDSSFEIMCLIPDTNYTSVVVGDIVTEPWAYVQTSVYSPYPKTKRRNSVQITTGSTAAVIGQATSGATGNSLTAASWAYRFKTKRAF